MNADEMISRLSRIQLTSLGGGGGGGVMQKHDGVVKCMNDVSLARQPTSSPATGNDRVA